jgi:hypothetical protein
VKRVVKKKVPQPPPIPNGSGIKFMRMTEPRREVFLDAGVFDYLWRIVETRYEDAVKKDDTAPAWVAHREMLERAVEAFRMVITAEQDRPPVTIKGTTVTRRVIKRK